MNNEALVYIGAIGAIGMLIGGLGGWLVAQVFSQFDDRVYEQPFMKAGATIGFAIGLLVGIANR